MSLSRTVTAPPVVHWPEFYELDFNKKTGGINTKSVIALDKIKAEKFSQELLTHKWKVNSPNDSNKLEHFVRFQLALCDMGVILGQWDVGKKIILNILDASMQHSDSLSYASCLSRLGEIYRLKSDFTKSREWLSKAQNQSKDQIDNKNY